MFRFLATFSMCFLLAVPAFAAKIGVAMSNSDVFLDQIRDSMISYAASQSNVDLNVEIAHGDAEKQMRQFKSFIDSGVDAIIVNPITDESSAPMQAMAVEAGIPLVYVNRMPPQNRFEGPVSLVSCNEIVAGRLQARFLAHMAQGKGNFVLLRGEDGHPAAAGRSQGVREVLVNEPGINLVHEETGNWNRKDAERVISSLLDKGVQIDIVGANNDEMAIGAINAFKKAGKPLDAVLIAGVDGTSQALEFMSEGALTFTLLQNAKAQGETAVANAVTMSSGGFAEQFQWVPWEMILPDDM